MESFFSRYRNALVLIAVLVAQLLALAIQARRPAENTPDRPTVSLLRYAVVAVVTPPERLVQGIGHWFGSLWYGYVDLIHVRRQNAGLQQEVQRLRLEQAAIAQDAAQGQRLEQLLGFKEHYISKTLPAQVIGTSGTDQSQVLYIDKGFDNGLAQDMPVITADGIVGKLKDVFPHTSQVLLVTDPTSGVGVILQTTRTRGILKGRPYGQLQVVDISPDSRIKAGEPVVTSGGDQIFPRGLPVGAVERIVPDPEHDPLVDVLIRPAAKLGALEEVLVITDLGGSLTPQQAKDLAESEAESEAEQQRAADILAQRLPSRYDPNAPADTNPSAGIPIANGVVVPAPLPQPPRPIHPDQFSPNAEPPATDMTPGRRWASVKYGTEDMPPPKHPAVNAASGKLAPGATSQQSPTGLSATPPLSSAPGQKPALQSQPKTGIITDGPVIPRHKPSVKRATPAPPQNTTQPSSNTSTPSPQGGLR